jgi:subtilisin family serine protease
VAALVLTACSDATTPTGVASVKTDAADAQGRSGYIITFRDGVADAPGLARRLAAANGGEIGFIYTTAIKGFSAQLTPTAAAALARNPNVEAIEADGVVSIEATQSGATWGLDRIDQANLPLSGTYTYTRTGAGVRAYIVDTGILGTHVEFTGRMAAGFTAISDRNGTKDCNGHGTHVAGTVGGTVYGVAKGVTLVPVRVLNCRGSGTNSGVIAGVDWVAAQSHRPAVANMSLGGGVSTALDNAVANAVSAGITFVVAAGNSNVDACTASPARTPSAITVGATTNTDARASYSNFGTCVDIFAPGSSITSAWYRSNTQLNTISGTSMASPHVAGVAALYLQGGNASPSTVTNALINGATTGKVTSAGTGSPNRLLFTAY